MKIPFIANPYSVRRVETRLQKAFSNFAAANTFSGCIRTPKVFSRHSSAPFIPWLYVELALVDGARLRAGLTFSGRFVLQWIHSEKAKKVVVPAIFWHLSFWGSVMNMIYFIHVDAAPPSSPTVFLPFLYGRNLYLLYKHQPINTVAGRYGSGDVDSVRDDARAVRVGLVLLDAVDRAVGELDDHLADRHLDVVGLQDGMPERVDGVFVLRVFAVGGVNPGQRLAVRIALGRDAVGRADRPLHLVGRHALDDVLVGDGHGDGVAPRLVFLRGDEDGRVDARGRSLGLIQPVVVLLRTLAVSR